MVHRFEIELRRRMIRSKNENKNILAAGRNSGVSAFLCAVVKTLEPTLRTIPRRRRKDININPVHIFLV